MGEKAAVEVRNVHITFKAKKQSTVALEDVSLDIREHEFFSILGPSGCGKSTLLLIIAGLIAPTSGKVAVQGNQVSGPVLDAGIVFQSHSLLEWRTVMQNVMLPIEIRGLPHRQFKERAADLLALVGLSGFENAYPHQLSGGMRQRVSLCRALVSDLPLLLMDEPFGALDALTREEHQLILQNVWTKERKTVLFITHDIREAILLSDRIAVMSRRPGRVIETFSIDLPRPRPQGVSETAEFNQYVYKIRSMLFDKEQIAMEADQ